MVDKPIVIATRGSALALAQTKMMLAACQKHFPDLAFEIKIIKTTGDKLQTAANADVNVTLPRGLFTKELEVALLEGYADFAVHSLKDLPTELPAGLVLGATPQRADVRDVLIFREAANGRRGFKAHTKLADLPTGAVIATSSNRRKAQLLAIRPDLNVVEIRGNVGTRLQKLVDNENLDAIVLAAAGLTRLNFTISADGKLTGDAVPEGIVAVFFAHEEMLPCVGQGAIGLEIREHDERIAAICCRLNHDDTFKCVTAERSLLRAMGGGCQTPIGAYAEVRDKEIHLRAISFLETRVRRAEGKRSANEGVRLGEEVAAQLKTSR